MKKLIAQTSILFESKMYAPGEELPTKNPEMVEAWLKAETAVWKASEDPKADEGQATDEMTKTDEVQPADEEMERPPVKAEPKTAETGVFGTAEGAETGEAENLVGKVPKTRSRKKA